MHSCIFLTHFSKEACALPHTTRASVGWCYRTYIFSLIFALQKWQNLRFGIFRFCLGLVLAHRTIIDIGQSLDEVF